MVPNPDLIITFDKLPYSRMMSALSLAGSILARLAVGEVMIEADRSDHKQGRYV
jgi:hypothetical protein